MTGSVRIGYLFRQSHLKLVGRVTNTIALSVQLSSRCLELLPANVTTSAKDLSLFRVVRVRPLPDTFF